MNWDDLGFLISKNKYNENSLITEVFTQKYGKTTGIVFGGVSKKIKNYLQIGNQIYVNYNSKSENTLGYFKIEIQKAYTPLFFENKKKLSCISSAMNLVKILTAEAQANKNIYLLINDLFDILKSSNWIKKYIFWELELFKNLGYHLDFKDLVDKKKINNEFVYMSKSSIQKKVVPNFLVDKNDNDEKIEDLLNGLRIVGDYLEKTILKSNNKSQPLNRIFFMNTLK